MKRIPALFLLGAVASTGVRITYDPFASTIYPYGMMQASSFRHIVVLDLTGHGVDYFYPALGSSVTDVNIYASPRGNVHNESISMAATGAKHVHVSGYMIVAGKRVAIVCGDRIGIPGHWREETAQFTSGGLTWHVTLSYLLRFRSLRPVMMHMVHSFHLR